MITQHFPSNGKGIRTSGEWAAAAKAAGFTVANRREKPGQAYARQYAAENGMAIVTWSDGRLTIYNLNGALLRLDANGYQR